MSAAIAKDEAIDCKLYFESIAFFNRLLADSPGEFSLCAYNNDLGRDFRFPEAELLLEKIKSNVIEYVDRFYGLKAGQDDLVLLHQFICAVFPGFSQPQYEPHDHRASDVVATYYLGIGRNEGLVRIWNPESAEGENIVLSPKSGELVLVPGNLPHDILEFRPSEPFVSVETHFSVRGFPRLALPLGR